jgi:hypothetical protein
MTITSLPSAPQPTDSTSEFNTKAFAWVAALDDWTDEVNALGVQVDADASSASDSADEAAASALVAAGAAAALNAQVWVSGTTYEIGDVVYSPIDFQTYRRKTDGAGTTDPSADATNWAVISGNVSENAVQTLTNKTLTAPTITSAIVTSPTVTDGTFTNLIITGGFETKTNIASANIDLEASNYFSKTISTNLTFTVSNVPTTGTVASFILDLTDGGAATITWWSGVKWISGTAPTLTSSGRDVLGFFTHDGGTTWTGLLLGKDVK